MHAANAKSGQYPGMRNFYMVTRGSAQGAAKSGSPGSRHSKAAEEGSSAPSGSRCTSESGQSARLRAGRRTDRTDQRAEPCSARWPSRCSLLIAGMIVFVFVKAWPSFSHNGLAWFGAGRQRRRTAGRHLQLARRPRNYVYTMHAWPLLYATR